MSAHSGCPACKGRLVFSYLLYEKAEGVHMVHLEPTTCNTCYPNAAEKPPLTEGWTEITEEQYNTLNSDPSYCDLDV